MKYNLYWGDIHNHNELGYKGCKGSLGRSIDIAKEHLDFFAFTGQAQWHDIKKYKNKIEEKWLQGFEKHKKNWVNIQKAIAEANIPGKFVAFLGYEWHSSTYGDYCIIYPSDYKELKFFENIKDLQSYVLQEDAIIIPHHIGYKKGHRGINWDFFNENTSPVVEIYSEHGCCERDNGPYPMINHSMGGRTTENTMQNALKDGHHFGVLASTDDHFGYPGAYGEGLVAVYSSALNRENIWEGIKNRRTYAVTGDRIKLLFSINDSFMGDIIPYQKDREIVVQVEGWDTIATIEVIKNNDIIYSDYPINNKADENLIETVAFRIEYGWGPWSDLSLENICDWEFELEVDNGQIEDICPCFQSGPFDETRRNAFNKKTKTECNWKSYTSRKDAFMGRATNSVIFKVSGDKKTKVELNLLKPVKKSLNISLEDILKESHSVFVGDFPKESVLIHRGVQKTNYQSNFNFMDTSSKNNHEDFYYVRVLQDNGQMAWSSPIWIGGGN
jgi:hypothetical protein